MYVLHRIVFLGLRLGVVVWVYVSHVSFVLIVVRVVCTLVFWWVVYGI